MTEKGKRIIALRKQGKTYGEIEHILNLPKSTIAWWLRDVEIKKSLQRKILERSRGKCRNIIIKYNKIYGKLRPEAAAKIREDFTTKASKEITKLSNRDLKLVGAALYWAEGNTKSRNRIQFSNSNSPMVKVAMRFFREICGIPDNKITARIHIYPGINYRKTLNFWSKLTGLPKNNFGSPQTQISKASSRRRKFNTLTFGTIHITISNTELACKVKGWIQGIVNNL